jgi:hypothetical protein
MANKDDIKNQEELNKQKEQEKKIVEQTLKTIKELEKTSFKMLEYQKELTKISGDSFSTKEAEVKILERHLDLENKRVTRKEDFTQEMKEELELQEKLIAGIKLEGETAAEAFARLKQETTGLNKEANKFGKEFFGGIASTIGIASDMSNTFLGSLQKLSLLASEPGGLKELSEVFFETFTFSKMAYGGMVTIAQATIAMAFASEKATAAFAAQTGAGRLLTNEIASVGSEYRNLGLTQEDAGKAAGALFNKFPGFIKNSGKLKTDLVLLTASLEKLGVSGDTTGEMLTSFTKGMGMTTSEAMRMTQSAALAAKSLQMSAGDYVKGLQSSLKVLSVYGKKATKIYQKLAAQAQAAGTSTERLLDIAGKFDTFSDSAMTAGKLNAILGSNLSANELLMASEEERIEILIKSMQMQGRSFNEMDKFTQKAVAATIGITDMNEAQKILGMDLSSYKKMNAEAAASAKTQEEMANRMKEVMDVATKLKMALAEFATNVAPFVKVLADSSQYILDFMHATRGVLGPIIAIGLGIATLTKIFSLFTPVFALLAWARGAKGIEEVGDAGGKAAPKLGAFGVSINLVGAGVMVAALGITFALLAFTALVGSLVLLAQTGPVAIGVLFGLAAVLYAFAAAVAVLANPITAIGMGILIGFISAMALLTLSMASLMKESNKSFESLGKLMSKGSELTKFTKNVTNLSKAIIGVGNAVGGLVLSLGGLALASPSLLVLEKVLSIISPFLETVATITENVSGIVSGLIELASLDMAKVFTDLSMGLNKIGDVVTDSEKGVQITHTLENLALITAGVSAKSQASGINSMAKAIGKIKPSFNVEVSLNASETLSVFEGNVLNKITKAS